MKWKTELFASAHKIQRFIFVIDAFTKGGAQKNLQLVLPELVEAGYQVDLVLLQNSSSELSLVGLKSSGVQIHRVAASSMFDLVGFLRFSKVLNGGHSLIVANLYWSQIWSSINNIFQPKNLLAWVEHNTYLNRSKAQWIVFRLLSKRVNRLLTVSKEIQEFITGKALCSTQLVNNAAISYFAREITSTDNPQFLLVGRLVEQKNPSLALSSFRSAINEGVIPKNSKLLIIGAGPLENQLKKEVKKLGIGSNLDFLGFIDSFAISKIMSQSHVLIMTSHHEGSPLVRLEALAHGMAIVTTRTAGIKDILTEPGTDTLFPGVFVPADNSEAIARDLGKAIEKNVWSHRAISLRLDSAVKFQPSKVAASYIELLEPH
jgi:glycosyltransferase involved in cell wall biosynthesis